MRERGTARAVVGNRTSVAESDLGQLPYMKAVMKEMLRLHPPVPVLAQRIHGGRDIEGYDIPGGGDARLGAFGIANVEIALAQMLTALIGATSRDMNLVLVARPLFA
ncbi:hypothetical protein HPP92_009681 [Vanilla planifolia]|uniref:Cytochrome P450 n=1 Tax=Vanilla planifolia TaxID=51239 RepID=A0A835V931_VANPL|nr:hypothetical protein HPP92_009681 [Vanilla planifolia]